MNKYEPIANAIKIAEIRFRTGGNYQECKRILNEIEKSGKVAVSGVTEHHR